MTHVQPQTPSRSAVTWRSAGLFALRYGIGAVMMLAGIVILAIDGGELGWYGLASAIGAGLSVILLNLLYRMSVSGDKTAPGRRRPGRTSTSTESGLTILRRPFIGVIGRSRGRGHARAGRVRAPSRRS
jgi:hypothetical protein